MNLQSQQWHEFTLFFDKKKKELPTSSVLACSMFFAIDANVISKLTKVPYLLPNKKQEYWACQTTSKFNVL